MTPEQQTAKPPWWRKLTTFEIVIYSTLAGLLLLVGLAAAATLLPSVDGGGGDPASAARDDVTMDSCVATGYGSPKANLTVRNSTDLERDYVITVVFERDGVQIGSGIATVVDLRAGQTAETDAVGFGTDTTGSIRCRVSDVSRR